MDKIGDFYPTGRASVETIHVLYEESDEWSSLKEKVQAYPENLFKKLYDYHKEWMLNKEDLGRVLLRKDILFYHQVLEDALDHFLQALYAKNHCYFSSRKRVQTYLDEFADKSINCYDRMLRIIRRASKSATIEESFAQLKQLLGEFG